MSVLPAWSMHHIYAWCLWRSEEGVGSPWTGITGGYEPPCGWWELNLNPLREFLFGPRNFQCVFWQQCCALIPHGAYVHTILDLKEVHLGTGLTRGRHVMANLSCHCQWVLSLLDMSVRISHRGLMTHSKCGWQHFMVWWSRLSKMG